MRAVLTELPEPEMGGQRDRLALVVAVPELRASMLDQLAAAVHLLADVIGERCGRDPAEPAVRALAGSIVGIWISVVIDCADDPNVDLVERLDDAVAQLPAGVAL